MQKAAATTTPGNVNSVQTSLVRLATVEQLRGIADAGR